MIATFANASWLATCVPEYRRFRRALRNVRPEQELVLRRILRRNESCEAGRRHGFSGIRTTRDFQERVPLNGYEVFRKDIERIAAGETQILTSERVRRFEPTSGSAGAAKWIPYTASLQGEFQRAIQAWVADMFLHERGLIHGPAYWSVSPAQQCAETTASGIPVGFADDSEYVGGVRRRLVQSVQAVPASIRHLRDIDEFWYATLLHLVRTPELRLISVWNPSFLTVLMDRLAEWGERLVGEEPSLRAALHAPTPGERHALLWPRLQVISCWADGNSAAAARKLATLFPHVRIAAKGLIATEGFVSFPWNGCDGAVLAVRSHFLEFLPVDSGDRPDPTRPCLADELDTGQTYSVVLTTGGGLYRYEIGDYVTVTGRSQQCPLVRFTGRRRISDWCGEKLHEVHVARVLDAALTRFGVSPAFAMLACDTSGATPNYVLYVEAGASREQLCEIRDEVELGLQENFHYAYARRLGQLGELRVFAATHAEASYLAACVARGQRAGDAKCVAVDPGDGWNARFQGRFIDVEDSAVTA